MRKAFTHPGFVRLFGDKGRAKAAQYPSIATFSLASLAQIDERIQPSSRPVQITFTREK